MHDCINLFGRKACIFDYTFMSKDSAELKMCNFCFIPANLGEQTIEHEEGRDTDSKEETKESLGNRRKSAWTQRHAQGRDQVQPTR